MDIRASLLRTAPVSGRQFAFFRIVLGAYLAVHFAHLIPYGAEIFSNQGTLPRASLSPLYGVFPNVLAVWDDPRSVTAFLSGLVVASLSFAAGVGRRVAALVLWYGWACLFNRNPLISNPSIAYIGLLLLLTTLVPTTESLRAFARRSDTRGFYMPVWVMLAAWVLMAVGYSYGGIVKLAAPSWLDGTAMWHVLNNPLARDSIIRDTMLQLPMGVFRLLTWAALALEVLFVPLAAWGVTRPFVWAAMVGMHLGLVGLVSFADLSLGMLILHLFTFDPAWTRDARSYWQGSSLRLRRPVPGRV